jgi:TolB-like protein/Tfp pilus assembly protein PilF
MSFWRELRRRNVVKVGAAYAIVAWLLLQIATNAFPALQLPAWTVTFVTVLLLIGFPIALIFAWAYEVTPEGIRKTGQVPREDSVTHVTGQKLNYLVTGLLVLAVAFIAVDSYVLEGDTPASGLAVDAGAPAEPAAEAAVSPVGIRQGVLPNSIAVLPLENLSPDPDNAYFAAGMHEAILNQLAKLKNLNVISRTSVMQYDESRPPIPAIARELNVEAIMEGSVRFDAGRVLVTAQLIDGATDRHLWSEQYERPLEGVFEIQADIAMNVANALRAVFTPAEQASIERIPTSSARAYALLLKATTGGVSAEEAQRLLDQALELDRDFALAHAAKSLFYAQGLTLTGFGSAADPARATELERLVITHAERAIALDPGAGTAHSALGSLYMFTWRWTAASESFERAFELAPGWDVGLSSYVFLCSYVGRSARAIEVAERLIELNPANPGLHGILGFAQLYARDFDAAAASLRFGAEFGGAAADNYRAWLVTAEIARGDRDAALRELEQIEQRRSTVGMSLTPGALAYEYSLLGRRDDAERLAREAIEAAGTGGPTVGAYLALGDLAAALERLERAAERAERHEPDPHFYWVAGLGPNLMGDPVLERPEFAAVLARIRGD